MSAYDMQMYLFGFIADIQIRATSMCLLVVGAGVDGDHLRVAKYEGVATHVLDPGILAQNIL